MKAPRVNDKRVDEATGERKRFFLAILPPWCRKSPKISEVLPLLYLYGLSSGDFVSLAGSAGRILSGRATLPPQKTAVFRSGARARQAKPVVGDHSRNRGQNRFQESPSPADQVGHVRSSQLITAPRAKIHGIGQGSLPGAPV